jgi:hypothetical protein
MLANYFAFKNFGRSLMSFPVELSTVESRLSILPADFEV